MNSLVYNYLSNKVLPFYSSYLLHHLPCGDTESTQALLNTAKDI